MRLWLSTFPYADPARLRTRTTGDDPLVKKSDTRRCKRRGHSWSTVEIYSTERHESGIQSCMSCKAERNLSRGNREPDKNEMRRRGLVSHPNETSHAEWVQVMKENGLLPADW